MWSLINFHNYLFFCLFHIFSYLHIFLWIYYLSAFNIFVQTSYYFLTYNWTICPNTNKSSYLSIYLFINYYKCLRTSSFPQVLGYYDLYNSTQRYYNFPSLQSRIRKLTQLRIYLGLYRPLQGRFHRLPTETF